MRSWLLCCLLLCTCFMARAGHIAGGEFFYAELSRTSTSITYKITLRLFRECNPPPSQTGQGVAQMPSNVQVGIFINGGGLVDNQIIVNRTDFQIVQLTSPPGCVTNAPEVCYQMGVFDLVQTLPINNSGYTIAYQTCCRTNGITNVGQNATGSTYTGVLTPGKEADSAVVNSSPVFTLESNINLVCQNRRVDLNFSATDADGDSLVYSFCDAYNGGAATNAGNIAPASPPYGSIVYSAGFSGQQPLGNQMSINSRTGTISGVSPAAGSYVVTVCVAEYRKGRLLGTNRKDFTLKIGACDFAEANLNPNTRVFCETLTYNFQNGSTSSSILSYAWDFGIPNRTDDTSSAPTPSFTFPDTGVFKIMLTVTGAGGCSSTDSLMLGVYPGFKAGFDVAGTCFLNPYQFTNRTANPYGFLNYTKWDFGVAAASDDTSRLANPSFTFPAAGSYPVLLTARNSKGCEDTSLLNLEVKANPPLSLAFRDTLICSGDTVQLQATTGGGVLRWTPATRISSTTVNNPRVYPIDTTLYRVTLDANGCVSRDSVRINVVTQAFVRLPADTAICLGDSFVINTQSNALTYLWAPDSSLNDSSLQRPLAFPDTTTTYTVLAKVSDRCQASGSLRVRVVPYPTVDLSGDSAICFGRQGRLVGTTNASRFQWIPLTGVLNPNSLSPAVQPTQTTRYILRATDTLGCPKPVSDTFVVRVVPPVRAFAGNDTVAVGGQPIQLNATGGQFYQWDPAWPLNRTDTSSPIATISTNIDSVILRVKVSTPEGCFAYDYMQIKIFQTGADIFVPSAFTPNADGRNDVLRAIPVGFRANVEFSVFNRLGQQVFFTSEQGKGWDGIYRGVPQPSGTYVYFAKGVDFTGKQVIKKGTAVLIR